MTKQIKITEERLIAEWVDFVANCDADILADLTGKAFGGYVEVVDTVSVDGWYEPLYIFEPNNDYCGAFDEEE